MADAKKKTAYVSKGERPNVSADTRALRRRERSVAERQDAVLKAAQRGDKRATMTIPNPNPNNTKERLIKISARERMTNSFGQFIAKK